MLGPLVALRESPARAAELVPGLGRRVRRGAGAPPPPGGPNGGGGGGGDGGGGEGSTPPDRPPGDDADPSRAIFALGLVLTGVTTLFCVLLGTWVLLRTRADAWPPVGAPEPPRGLWLSSAVLLASSAVLWRGQRALRARRLHGLARAAGWATLLGAVFLALQVACWLALVEAGLRPSTNGYGAIFYALTAAHALHVVVGVALLARLTLLARRHPRAPTLPGVTTVASAYWHFLGLLWAVLFVLLTFVR